MIMIPNVSTVRRTPDASAAPTDQVDFAPERGPLPAVLDTACVRTGLHFQLANGCPPLSVRAARTGSLRLFMEYDTLIETIQRLSRFANQFKVAEAELRRIFSEDWLPHIDVVRLPASWRETDQRACGVRDRDADDYPAAALAALLSPCILLTHNYKDFRPLGVMSRSQGVDGVLALVDREDCEGRANAAAMIPFLPGLAVVSTTRWASQRIGPWAWAALGAVVAGGMYVYLQQPPQTRGTIKKGGAEAATLLAERYSRAATAMRQAQEQLVACVVPGPSVRSAESAIARELAVSPESLSAQQLFELIDPALRPSVTDLRSLLKANDEALFTQVRRGGFTLGRRYELWRLPSNTA